MTPEQRTELIKKIETLSEEAKAMGGGGASAAKTLYTTAAALVAGIEDLWSLMVLAMILDLKTRLDMAEKIKAAAGGLADSMDKAAKAEMN